MEVAEAESPGKLKLALHFCMMLSWQKLTGQDRMGCHVVSSRHGVCAGDETGTGPARTKFLKQQLHPVDVHIQWANSEVAEEKKDEMAGKTKPYPR